MNRILGRQAGGSGSSSRMVTGRLISSICPTSYVHQHGCVSLTNVRLVVNHSLSQIDDVSFRKKRRAVAVGIGGRASSSAVNSSSSNNKNSAARKGEEAGVAVDVSDNASPVNRRTVAVLAALMALYPLPSTATAATSSLPSNVKFGPSNPFLLPLPPQPIALPRRRLNLPFAILLLASGYDTADRLDFIAMQDFQKDFWLLRGAEWEPYTLQYSPLKITQGDLSDPQYFDFIAAMQFSSVTIAMKNGLQTFKEYCGDECPPSASAPTAPSETEGQGAEDEFRLITRDPSLQDNALLPSKFEAELGAAIYTGLRNGFRGTQFSGAPAPCSPQCSAAEVLKGVQQLLAVFVQQGFCINADIIASSSLADNSLKFSVKVDGPANLWALQSVTSRRGNLWPVYDALAVAAFLRESGRSATCSFSWTSTGVMEDWVVV